MRQTLVRIPLDGPWSLGPLGNVPGFGFGLVLACWILFGAYWLYRNRRGLASTGALAAPVVAWFMVAVAIVLVPWFVQRSASAAVDQANRILAANPNSVEALLSRSQAR